MWWLPFASLANRNNCAHSNTVQVEQKEILYSRNADNDGITVRQISYEIPKCTMCGKTGLYRNTTKILQKWEYFPSDGIKYKYALKMATNNN